MRHDKETHKALSLGVDRYYKFFLKYEAKASLSNKPRWGFYTDFYKYFKYIQIPWSKRGNKTGLRLSGSRKTWKVPFYGVV